MQSNGALLAHAWALVGLTNVIKLLWPINWMHVASHLAIVLTYCPLFAINGSIEKYLEETIFKYCRKSIDQNIYMNREILPSTVTLLLYSPIPASLLAATEME